MTFRPLATLLAVALLLCACGGGGGGGSDNGGGGGGGGGVLIDFPVLTQDASFSLPAIASPPTRIAVAGTLQGQVLVTGGAAAPAGLLVELLDASQADAPQVLASAQTDANGTYTLADSGTGLAPSARWIRVTLGSGTTMRAYPGGWTEITPGTEVAVSEFARLLRAGAFSAHALTASELADAQASLSLLWLGQFGARPVPEATVALREMARFNAPWNQQLDNLALAVPVAGAGDIAGLMPAGTATWPSSVTSDGSTIVGEYSMNCFGPAERQDCGWSSQAAPATRDHFVRRHTGVFALTEADAALATKVLAQVGELPLIDHPHAVGTKTLFENGRITLDGNAAIHASVKVTRHTYPAGPVQAMGGSVQAVQVVMDYEVAMIDTGTQVQTDLLSRERRWFSPQAGLVRTEVTRLQRSGGKVTQTAYTVVANSVGGSYATPQVQPFAGAADVRSVPLRHRHAIYSPTLDKIFVATDVGGGQVLEIDPATMATTRSAALSAVPGRLALSADGLVLYAGLDNGSVLELDTLSFSQRRQFSLIADPYGRLYDRVLDMAVDPFDWSRVVLIAGQSSVFGSTGAVLTFRQGNLVLRDAPLYNAMDYGWGRYLVNAVAWTDTADEFTALSLASPHSLYRFRAGAAGYSQVTSLERDDDVALREVRGEILTDRGRKLDATTLTSKGTLGLAPFGLTGCQRLNTLTDLCGINSGEGWSPPFFVHLDHATSAFLGTYRPAITQVDNACPELDVRAGSLGLDNAELSAMGDGRMLVSTLPKGDGVKCGLQVWSLHGVAR